MLSGTVKILDDQAIVLVPTPSRDPKGKSAELCLKLLFLTWANRSAELAKMAQTIVSHHSFDM